MSSPSRSSRDSHDALKYAPGVGARVPPAMRPLRTTEWLALLHAGLFLVAITWAFGGAAEWLRPHFAWFGGIGIFLTFAAMRDRDVRKEGGLRPLTWLWPFAAFNALVLISCLNSSFRIVKSENETLFLNTGGFAWLPSTARPSLSLQALWIFDALWIPAFNLTLLVRQRRALRGLLIVAVVNAVALSIFGTVQKLTHAKGIYFGEVPTPQAYFFASFVYHNHWGAFSLLMMAACLGLAWHFGRRHDARNFFHSAAFGGLVALLLITATVPLSGSRSSTILGTLLLGGAFLHWAARLYLSRRHRPAGFLLPIGGAVLALVLAAGSVWYVARETIEKRASLTRDQVANMLAKGGVGSRSELYRDTWRMAQDKRWFGWGMASYPHVFSLYNRQSSIDRLPVFYRDAHSDWLQSFAEHGFVGTVLLALCGLVPLTRLRRRHFASPLPAYLLAGCGLLLLYAWVEFPFGNLAVVFSWWLCFFTALHYARLQDREAPSPTKVIASTAAGSPDPA